MTERQPYDVVERRDGYEIRSYPESHMAQVDVRGTFSSAGNIAFRPLIRYISGANVASQKIAMTAPVIQEPQGTTYRVSFVMPASMSARDLPLPADARVAVATVPARLVAAIGFRGNWNEQRFAEQSQRLLSALRRDGLSWRGEPFYARFDPPWKPGFLKYSEALVELDDTSGR